jgi:hypothetical protein
VRSSKQRFRVYHSTLKTCLSEIVGGSLTFGKSASLGSGVIMTNPKTSKKKKEVIALAEKLKREFTDLVQIMAEVEAMQEILRNDILECAESISGDNKSDCGNRTFVRAVFALIEGGIYGLKQVALQLSKHERGNFTPAEVALLEDKSYDLDDKGRAQERTKFVPISSNIKFAFAALARAYPVNYTLKTDGKGWDAFQAALKTRNRITHPKTVDDLKLTDDEVQQSADAATWFLKNHANVIQAYMKKLEPILDRFKLPKSKASPA